MRSSVLTMIMAGGRGERLAPLTNDRAKPAVPFAGGYRIIDFTLSNCVHSGLFHIGLLTQYKSQSLCRHIDYAWKPFFHRDLGQQLDVIPPQKRVIDDWYRGTADAVYQNLDLVTKNRPEDVLILAGDHVYRMDYRRMIEFHRDRKADVTIGAVRVPLADARKQLGVLQVDDFCRVMGFQEKPDVPRCAPGDSNATYASMGIYLFQRDFLLDVLQENAAKKNWGHDFGSHVIPSLIERSRVIAYPFDARSEAMPYWRDVGTIESYFHASMEMLSEQTGLLLEDSNWPIHSYHPNLSPAQFRGGLTGGRGTALRSSIVCSGTSFESSAITGSILGYSCRVGAKSTIEQSVLFGETRIGNSVRLRRVIADKNCTIPDGTHIGFDAEADRNLGCIVTEGGITVLPRNFGNPNSTSKRCERVQKYLDQSQNNSVADEYEVYS